MQERNKEKCLETQNLPNMVLWGSDSGSGEGFMSCFFEPLILSFCVAISKVSGKEKMLHTEKVYKKCIGKEIQKERLVYFTELSPVGV